MRVVRNIKIFKQQTGEEVVEFYETEYEMLNKFFQKYLEIRPTIISGWNSEFFDIPYLYNRAVRVLGPEIANLLSPISKVIYSEYKKKHTIAGVSSLDYLQPDLWTALVLNIIISQILNNRLISARTSTS